MQGHQTTPRRLVGGVANNNERTGGMSRYIGTLRLRDCIRYILTLEVRCKTFSIKLYLNLAKSL